MIKINDAAIKLVESLSDEKKSLNLDQRMKIHYIYEEWLMKTFPEDIATKEDLLEATDRKMFWDEFVKTLYKEVY